MALTSSSTLRSWWADWKCAYAKMAKLYFFGRFTGTVPASALPAYAALEQALRDTGYTPYSRWTYNCRNVNLPSGPTTTPSLHSYGIAIDIDPSDNRYSSGDPFSGKFKPHHIAAVESIKTGNGKQVWAWGGRWRTPDRMHFQINVSPADLATGIVYKGAPIAPPEEDDMALKRGDKGNAVTKFQKALETWKPGILPQYGADGDFGAETEAAVKQYQNAAQVPATGQIDGVTAALLGDYFPDTAGTEDAVARQKADAASAKADAAATSAARANSRLDAAKAAL